VARGRCLWPWVGAEEAGGRLDEDEQQLPEEADSGHALTQPGDTPPLLALNHGWCETKSAISSLSW
jgi:hypothetical protein